MGDGTWIYPTATQIASVSLTKDAPSLLKPKNDAFKKDEKKEKEGKDENEEKKSEKDTLDVTVEVNFDNLEARLVLLPPEAGNIAELIPFEDKLVYLRRPNTGSGEESSSLI